jgi:hypothetical protein
MQENSFGYNRRWFGIEVPDKNHNEHTDHEAGSIKKIATIVASSNNRKPKYVGLKDFYYAS